MRVLKMILGGPIIALVGGLYVLVVCLYLLPQLIHDTIYKIITGNRISRGRKSGHISVRDKDGFTIDGEYRNLWCFYRGKKLNRWGY